MVDFPLKACIDSFIYLISDLCECCNSVLHQMFPTYEYCMFSLLLLKPLCTSFMQNVLFFNIQIFLCKNQIICNSFSSLM